MTGSFWDGRKVFVTGHTGFKGGWLCLWLQHLGAEVTGFALSPPTCPSLFEVARVGQGMRSIIGDIRDANALAIAMKNAAPEIVIHMAAQPLVRYSYVAPVETYSTNVMGTVHVLETVRTTPAVKAVVNVTSDKCYENREWLRGYRETDPMGGHDPYSNSKGCAELVTAAYRKSFFDPATCHENGHPVALASARAGNSIGGGDWAQDRLIPDIVRSITDGAPVPIRSPNAIRPWQHVVEPLSGYLLLAEKLFKDGTKYAAGWNFGPQDNDARSVQWVVEKIVELWGDGARWNLEQSPQPHEAGCLKLDCSKARTELGWEPRWGLQQTLARAVAWYKAYYRGEDMREMVLAQINEYCKTQTT